MPFTATVPTPAVVTGKILLVLSPDEDPEYSSVSQLDSPWLLGSSFQIEEIWEIRTRIIEPSLVTVFEQYPFNRYKLGNWANVSADNVPSSNPSDQGFLHYLVQRYSKSSFWTVGLDTAGAAVVNGIEEIDNCNFATRELTIGFGGVLLSTSSPVVDQSLFKIRKTAKSSLLQNFRVRRQAPRLGLYLFPGVELVQATYSMAIVNLAKADASLFTANACVDLGTSCDDEFLAFRESVYPIDSGYPGNFADGQGELGEGTHIFSSLGAAEAAIPGQVFALIFNCSDGGFREYWVGNAF